MPRKRAHRPSQTLPPVREPGASSNELLAVEQKVQDAACALRRAREAAPAPHRHAIIQVERAIQAVAQRLVAAAEVSG